MRAKGEGSVFEQKKKRKDGSIYSRWCAEINTGTSDDKYKTKKPLRQYFDTKQEAIEWKNKILADKQKGLVPTTSSTTIDKYYHHWIDIKKKQTIKPKTEESYKQLYEKYIKPTLGAKKIQKITPSMLNTFFSKLLETLAPTSVIKVKAVLSSMLNMAINEGILAVNPVPRTEIIKKNVSQEIHIYTQDQIKLILATAKQLQEAKGEGHRYTYDIVRLALTTGARLGELLALKWSNIDLDGNTISIKETVNDVIGGLSLGTPKSKASNRTIAIDKETLDQLVLRKKEDIDLVFHSRSGNLVGVKNMSRAFRGLLKKCKIKDLRFHDLRHTHATMLITEGYDINEVAKRLGHDNPSVTLKTYSHFMPQRDRDAAEAIGGIISKSIV